MGRRRFRSTKSQQLHDLRHAYLLGSYLGTFTTSWYRITIDGEQVKGTWSKFED